jgi:GGDEF domain-containing protein
VSIGLANFPEDATEPEALLRIADDRMYEDKTPHAATHGDGKPSSSR